jgi:hypothetical protein
MSNRIRILALGAALAAVLGGPARAAEPDRQLSIDYEVYLGGLNALKLTLEARLGAARYDMGVRLATQGFAGWLVDWRMTADSKGMLRDGQVRPMAAQADSVWRGRSRRQLLEYGADGAVMAKVDPPVDPEHREPVPSAMQGNSMDLAGALLSTLRAVGAKGRCEHKERVFDGRRLYDFSLRHEGEDMLKPNDYSPYGGPAIRCRIKVEMLAGRLWESEESDEDRRRRGDAIVWLAPVFENAPLMPVRMQYELRFGAMTAYLRAARLKPMDGPVQSLAARK